MYFVTSDIFVVVEISAFKVEYFADKAAMCVAQEPFCGS
jgi:hypothetical protein